MKKKFRPRKEPSLLRKVVQVYWERGQEKKAERELSRLTWSLDFLKEVLARAAEMSGGPLEMVIRDKDGREIRIRSLEREKSEGSILDHLDDDAAVSSFILHNSVR